MHTPSIDLQDPALQPGDFLSPELDDAIDYLEKGDYVRIERLVKAEGAPAEFGTILRTNPQVQYALVQLDHGRPEWFSLDEVYLVLKASALEITAPAEALDLGSRVRVINPVSTWCGFAGVVVAVDPRQRQPFHVLLDGSTAPIWFSAGALDPACAKSNAL